MKDRASHDGKGSVPHTSADTSLQSTFPARSAASRAEDTLHSKKRAFVQEDKSSFFVCHVNPMDQFPSWWHKTVPQRSGHSFEARSSGASSHFVPLHHDPATRSRCRSEETPRPAKRPRRKAGARAKRGVSELCFRYTIDERGDSCSFSHSTQERGVPNLIRPFSKNGRASFCFIQRKAIEKLSGFPH